MAANDTFPRGWTASAAGLAGPASITIPASPGVAHVLDAFTAAAYAIAGAAVTGPLINLNSSDGVYVNFPLGFIFLGTAPTNDSGSGSSLGLAANPGASITVSFSTWEASTFELLTIQGHDI